MAFISFNYWNLKQSAWIPTIYNLDQIARSEPDALNAGYTRLWLNGDAYPGLLTDIQWTTAPTTFGAAPPPAPPTITPKLPTP